MRTRIDFAVAWANDAYERRAAEARLNLVGTEEVDYVEEEVGANGRYGPASVLDLGRLQAPWVPISSAFSQAPVVPAQRSSLFPSPLSVHIRTSRSSGELCVRP